MALHSSYRGITKSSKPRNNSNKSFRVDADYVTTTLPLRCRSRRRAVRSQRALSRHVRLLQSRISSPADCDAEDICRWSERSKTSSKRRSLRVRSWWRTPSPFSKKICSICSTIKALTLHGESSHKSHACCSPVRRYDDVVDFQDPVTSYSSIGGYLFNLRLLKNVFSPVFTLHDIRQTGEYEVTTRWTMQMSFTPAANTPLKTFWNPQLTFTGMPISI